MTSRGGTTSQPGTQARSSGRSEPSQPAGEHELREAAQAVVDRWETPLWKDAEPTAHVVERLRAALESEPVSSHYRLGHDLRENVAQLRFMSANLRNQPNWRCEDFKVLYHERNEVADNIDATLSALQARKE